jgi:hypothetical protein
MLFKSFVLLCFLFMAPMAQARVFTGDECGKIGHIMHEYAAANRDMGQTQLSADIAFDALAKNYPIGSDHSFDAADIKWAHDVIAWIWANPDVLPDDITNFTYSACMDEAARHTT